jgi:hypothetical protein
VFPQGPKVEAIFVQGKFRFPPVTNVNAGRQAITTAAERPSKPNGNETQPRICIGLEFRRSTFSRTTRAPGCIGFPLDVGR